MKKYPKAKGVISYHTNAVEISDIINKTRPRLTILNHVLSLDGSSDDEIPINKTKTKHDVLIAKDLMTIDVKDDIYIYKQKTYDKNNRYLKLTLDSFSDAVCITT